MSDFLAEQIDEAAAGDKTFTLRVLWLGKYQQNGKVTRG